MLHLAVFGLPISYRYRYWAIWSPAVHRNHQARAASWSMLDTSLPNAKSLMLAGNSEPIAAANDVPMPVRNPSPMPAKKGRIPEPHERT